MSSIAKMASIHDNKSRVTGDADLSFLDLKDCSLETRTYLLALLEDESKPKTSPVQATSVTPATSASEVASSVTQAQQQHPAQHHFQQVYATPPTSQPYVYINNVTANVNVHHGAEQPQMKSLPVNSHAGSGFPPPPPNPMAFANPPVVSAPAPIPNGIGIQQTHQAQAHAQAYLYQQQIAALAAKAGAAQYMSPVIYYPYPIPVSQQTPPPAAPHPQTRGPQPNIIRNTPSSYPPNMVTSSNEVFYPQQIHASPLQTPVHIPTATATAAVVVTSTAAAVVTSTAQDTRPSQIEKDQPRKNSTVVTEAENSVTKTLPPKSETSEPPPPPVTKKEVISSDETKPSVKAQQQQPAPQQQQAEKTPLKKEDSSATVKESEAAVKTPSSGGGGGAGKSWASLFKKEIPASMSGSTQSKPTARIQPYTNVGDEGIEGKPDSKRNKDEESQTRSSVRHVNTNPNDVDMAKFLQLYALNHRSSMIKPRGLSNRNNWCFVNAILQAIVACPPFYNLMKSLPNDTMKRGSMVKVTKVVHDFVAEFSPLDHFPKINRRDKGKKNEDLPLGMTFEASSIFGFLLNLTSDTFKVEDGRQEDAEEFLTFLLNELNDEMLLLLKLLVENQDEEDEEGAAGAGEDEEDNDEWHEVGARNKSLLTRRVGNAGESLRSPVGCIFQGQLQSCVTSSNGEPTATLQPFFTLPLDIQSKNIKNVSDALLHNFTSETIDGYMCSKTNKQIEASRSLYLDELPSVLVLHLKRFIYDETSSAGCQKLLKNIDFPVDLEIPKDILSNNSKNKYHNKQRSYKLFAVVYHNGKHASDGHYVTDVYHAGLGWLHCDDSLIKSMTETMVMAHSANSVPYILFYRRGDTMGPGPNGASGLNVTK